jgi:hypothetical protein
MVKPGKKEGGIRKDKPVYLRWLRRVRAQLQAVIALFIEQGGVPNGVTSTSTATSISTGATSAADSALAMVDGTTADSDSDVDGDDLGSDSDDEDDGFEEEHNAVLECFINIGGVRETHEVLAGPDSGQQYHLYVPPGGGRKLCSLAAVQQYLDLPRISQELGMCAAI